MLTCRYLDCPERSDLTSSRDEVDGDVVSVPDLFFGNRSDGNFADVGLKCLRLRLYC